MNKRSFPQLFAQEGIAIAPGVYDGISAKLAANLGFSCLYASGGAIARSCGLPDINLLSLEEVVRRVEQISDAVSLPVLADMDTGFGNTLNTRRATQLFERSGVAGIHIEDQIFPKRCGHLNDKTLVPTAEMVAKVKMVLDTRVDQNFWVVARTDAIAVEGFEPAIERACAYAEAGADMIFIEAPTSAEQIESIAQQVKAPLLINMFAGGKTPMIERDTLAAWGYKLIIIPSDLQRAALFSMQETLKAIAQDGNSQSYQEQMISFAQREELVETNAYLKLDQLL